jgi:hypothetical protein
MSGKYLNHELPLQVRSIMRLPRGNIGRGNARDNLRPQRKTTGANESLNDESDEDDDP